MKWLNENKIAISNNFLQYIQLFYQKLASLLLTFWIVCRIMPIISRYLSTHSLYKTINTYNLSMENNSKNCLDITQPILTLFCTCTFSKCAQFERIETCFTYNYADIVDNCSSNHAIYMALPFCHYTLYHLTYIYYSLEFHPLYAYRSFA